MNKRNMWLAKASTAGALEQEKTAMSDGKALFDRHWAKFQSLDRRDIKPDDFIVISRDCRERLEDFDPEQAVRSGIACQLHFDLFKGFTISAGLPIDDDEMDDWAWARSNFRWAFMYFLEGNDAGPDILRAAAAALRQFADMADYVASENDEGRYPTDRYRVRRTPDEVTQPAR